MLKIQSADRVETSVPPCASEALWPDSPPIHIELFRAFNEVEAIWRRAQENCRCYGFQTFEWLSTWHDAIGAREGIEPWIVHVSDANGDTLMLLPLGVERRLGLSFLTLLGGAVTDYKAPIIRPDFAASLTTSATERLVDRILKRLPRIDVIALENMPSVIEGVPNPFVQLPGSKHVCNAWVAGLGDSFQDFKKRRSAKFFSTAARKRRRLAELGPTSLCIADTPEAVAEMMRAFVPQKRRRWQELGSADLFTKPGYLLFYASLAQKHLGTGLIQIAALRVGEALVATHWGMVFRDRFYWLMPTYETGDWARFSVGRLLMQSLIEWSISRRLRWFDLTIGDEEYKQLWADYTLPLHNHVQGLTIKGRVYRRLRQAGEHMKSFAARSQTLRRMARIWRRHRALWKTSQPICDPDPTEQDNAGRASKHPRDSFH